MHHCHLILHLNHRPTVRTTMLSLVLNSLYNFTSWNISDMETKPEQMTEQWLFPSAYQSLKIGIITTLGCLIILGNAFVLLVIASSVSGWSRNSRYILISLTGTDVTLAVIVVPLNLYGSLALEPSGDDVESPIGPYCHIVAFINSSVFASSIYSLSIISLERYIAVFYPLSYNRVMSRRRVKMLIASAWLLPPIFLCPISIPSGTVINVYFSRASLICNPDYASNVPYSVILTAVIFFPCSVIVTFANLRLWLVARKQNRRMSIGWPGRIQRPTIPTVSGNLAEKNKNTTSKDMWLRRDTRDCSPSRGDPASRVLIPVVIVFYTCWAPCMVTILYNAITQERVPEWVEFAALWLPSGNGFLNCFVYFWINRSFRHKFQKLGQKLCLWQCCSPPKKGRIKIVVMNGAVDYPRINETFSLQERSCSLSSTCMLLQQATDTNV
ncbi:D(4) dopamine receptor [Bombina bombina]|uniref:D(4) dopamine receptor n=1 Tax=Bombina bombina TaxID=8345 RepID=UPI00235A83A7|nr:D(4) dopamine receptor [Bombina bombina]